MRKLMTCLLLVAAGFATTTDAARPGGDAGAPSYPGENLATLPGDKHSDAWGVNARGNVVGRSYNVGRQTPTLIKAFYWNGAMRRLLPATEVPAGEIPWDSEAWAISNEATETVVGLEERTVCIPDPNDDTQRICDYEQYPLVWKDPASSVVAERIDASSGRAFGINGSGDLAVGWCGGGIGAVWSRSGGGWSRTTIQSGAFPAEDLVPSFPDGHDLTGHVIEFSGTAFDVNDEGVVVGSLTWIDRTAEAACLATDVRPCAEDVAYSRAFIYFAKAGYGPGSGTGRVLPSPSGHTESSAYAVSDLVSSDTAFYVAGSTRVHPDDDWGNGIRWTVSLDGQGVQAVELDVLEQQAWSQGVNEAGHVAGTTNSKTSRRGNVVQTATLFQQSVGYVSLTPPKGGSDSASRAMAGVGPIYVVGSANVKGAWQAARWTIP